MKARCETRRERQPSPHFVLRNKAEHLNHTRRGKSATYERFIKAFLKGDQDRLN